MLRGCNITCILCLFLAGLSGCASSLESRTISDFIRKMEAADLEGLREMSSSEFRETALRHQEATDALKLLNLPDGKVEVQDIKEISKTEKQVTVAVGEKQRRLIYTLVLDPESKKWVVDDIQFKRRLKPGQVNKTVAQQVDLILSIQEFVEAWKSGERSAITAASTKEFADDLQRLSPPMLKRLSKQVTEGLQIDDLKPEFDGHAQHALVKLRRKSGDLLVTFKEVDGQWRADDFALQTRREEDAIPSLRKQTAIIRQAMDFMQAYQRQDKATLEKLTMSRFYRLYLANAKLDQFPLPTIDFEGGEFDVKLLLTRAEVIARNSPTVLQISLSQGHPELNDDGEPVLNRTDENGKPKPFLVEEITIHDKANKQEKRLSALMASHALVQEYARALHERDLKAIRLSSTTDFNQRVWQKLSFDDFVNMPLDNIESGTPQIVAMEFKGPITEVTVDQGETPLTYVLRDQGGRIAVDDILRPTLELPSSMKLSWEIIIPWKQFTAGLSKGQFETVRKASSREFNRLVFSQLERLPVLPVDPVAHLRKPLQKIQVTSDRAVIQLGDERQGAKIFYTKEAEGYMVDDVLMIDGIEARNRVGLKQILREQIATGRVPLSKARKTVEASDLMDDELLRELELK